MIRLSLSGTIDTLWHIVLRDVTISFHDKIQHAITARARHCGITITARDSRDRQVTQTGTYTAGLTSARTHRERLKIQLIF